MVGAASENFAVPLTLPCQAESRGYYIDAADYRAGAAVCSAHITNYPSVPTVSLSPFRRTYVSLSLSRGMSNI